MITDLGYKAPETLDETLEILQKDFAGHILAGGTDLLVEYYENLEKMGWVVDINRLEELKGIKTGEKVFLGALTTHDEIARSEILQRMVPFLCRAARSIGAPQIRHRGTLGGNLANASPAADLAPPLMALEADVFLRGPGGERKIALQDFFKGPGETVLERGELLLGVEFSVPKRGYRDYFYKTGQRKAQAIAVSSLAIRVNLGEENIEDIKIACGSVAFVPLVAEKTENLLRGKKFQDLPLEEAVKTIEKEVSPIDDIRATAAYRKKVTGNLLRRGLEEILTQKGDG